MTFSAKAGAAPEPERISRLVCGLGDLTPHTSTVSPSCGKPTLWGILSQHGGRCIGCYERYLREPQPMPQWMRDRPKTAAQRRNVLNEPDDVDTPERAQHWREQQQRVAQYARDRGITLERTAS